MPMMEVPEILKPCPVCGEEHDGVNDSSIRWNGANWEHKSTEAHPQVGHHVMRAGVPEEKEHKMDLIVIEQHISALENGIPNEPRKFDIHSLADEVEGVENSLAKLNHDIRQKIERLEE